MPEAVETIATRQRSELLFEAPGTPLAPGTCFTTPTRLVAGFSVVSLFGVSNQPFTVQVAESCSPTGPFAITGSFASASDAVSGFQFICDRISPCAANMHLVICNTGASPATVLDVCGTGIPKASTSGSGAGGAQGFQGNNGNQGFQGPQGFQGFQGQQGRQGSQGLQGTNPGVQGPQGFQGNQGFQGSSALGTDFSLEIVASTPSATSGTGLPVLIDLKLVEHPVAAFVMVGFAITIPVTGRWFVYMDAIFAADTGGTLRTVNYLVNGVNQYNIDTFIGNMTGPVEVQGPAILDMNAGDLLSFQGVTDSLTNPVIDAGAAVQIFLIK